MIASSKEETMEILNFGVCDQKPLLNRQYYE